MISILMIKICHIADIHIYNNTRHDEYKIQFEKLYDILKKEKINIVTIVGDLFESFNDIENEAQILASEFLNKITDIVDECIVVYGNHDCMKRNRNRVNSVETVTKLINNNKIKYLGSSDFFDDDIYPIVWVNYSHLQKNINPWKDIQHTKDDTKTYIDLFHDPIQNCKNDLGFVFSKSSLRKITDFKSDIVMLGDIHKLQYFRDDKTAAYCGSLIVQNFGEKPNNHGCIIWSIDNKNISSKFIDIPNDHNYINFEINENFDYDDINFKDNNIKSLSEFKVKWKDVSSQVNKDNEIKIRQFFDQTYGKNIRIEKNPVYTDVISGKMLSESIDVNDLNVQQNIIIEYLKNNKYEDSFIKEIIDIDSIINSRLHLQDKSSNIVWNISKLWFNNFKSYGDGNELQLMNGITQINGVNKQGKSTLLDAISYILYGTTISTLSRQKNGDNRYINNKRNLDFCDGGIVLNINEEYYTLYRKTNRSFKKDSMTCSTTLDIYSGMEMIEDNKLTEEIRIKTQNKIDKVLGDFDDFIRLVLTTADNLNDLLSMDRSIFIDSIIRDAGYDIFDKKLCEFKDYKKEFNDSKIVIDVVQEKNKIVDLCNTNKELDNQILSYNNDILQIRKYIDSLIFDKDVVSKKLYNIDSDVQSLDINFLKSEIINHNTTLSNNSDNIQKLNKNILDIPVTFDYELLNEKQQNFKTLNLDFANAKINISKYDNKISNIENNILSLNNEISNLKKDYIQKLKNEVSSKELLLNNNKNLFILKRFFVL